MNQESKTGAHETEYYYSTCEKVFGDFNFIELTVPKDFVKIFRISVDAPRGTTRGVRAGHQLRFDKVFWDGQFDKIKVSEDFLRKLSSSIQSHEPRFCSTINSTTVVRLY